MKKILFVNDEMTMGGVARILNTLLKKLSPEEYDIDLLVLHPRGELLKEIPNHVHVLTGTSFFDTVDIPLKQCRGKQLFHKLRLLFYMKTGRITEKIRNERKKILSKKYDVEFAAKEGFCSLFVASGDSAKKLNWIQVDYRQHNYSANHMSLMRKELQNIDVHIACSENVLASYQELFGIQNGVVIHNLMDDEKIHSLAAEKTELVAKTDNIQLITVARFHPQKALDRLLRVYQRVQESYDCVIIGDGEQRQELYQLAKELGIFEKIHWLGLQENPYPHIRQADLFVMTSLYEGYPTITIESFLSGTPVLTTEVAGVKEQFLSPEQGWIVENSEDALYQKLLSLQTKKELLQEMKRELHFYHYHNEEILRHLAQIFNK